MTLDLSLYNNVSFCIDPVLLLVVHMAWQNAKSLVHNSPIGRHRERVSSENNLGDNSVGGFGIVHVFIGKSICWLCVERRFQ